jgi:hypothetical protein
LRIATWRGIILRAHAGRLLLANAALRACTKEVAMLRSLVMSSALAVCVSALLGGSEPQSQPTIIQQDRHVNSWVWIGGCPQQVQNVAATDHGPFDAEVSVEPSCPVGEGVASASQHSEALANGFSATGVAHFSIGSPQSVVIHSSARSRFDVTFQLEQRQRFAITGTISAGRTGNTPTPGAFASSSLSLSTGATVTGDLFNVTLNPPFNQPAQKQIEAAGFIQPGTNRVVALATMFADQSFNNAWVDADATFDIEVVFTDPADINGDGLVNVVDLLAVISAWGLCPAPPAPCGADANGDGAVNVADLLTVIKNWS